MSAHTLRARMAPCRDTTGIEVTRGLAAAGVLLSAALHLELWDVENFRSIATIGPLFLLNAIGGLGMGVGLLVWRHWLPGLAAAGFGASTLVGFYLSVYLPHGLFGFKEGLPTSSAAILAEVAEYGAVVFGLASAALCWRASAGRARQVRDVDSAPAT